MTIRARAAAAPFSYLAAVLFVAAAVAARWLLDPWLGEHLTLITTFAAVAAAVWLGGLGPALVAAALAFLASNYLFIEPRGTLGLAGVPQIAGLVAYAVTCAFIIGFGEALRRARTRAGEGWALLRRADDAVRESEERFRALAENIPQLAWMTRRDGWIFWYNRRWFEYTGTTLEEMQGWGWQAVHHPDHVERVTERFRSALESGDPWEDTFPLRGRDGGYRWFLSRAFPLRDSGGEVAGWFGTNTDITELLEADRRKDEFLATLAHELRNPLAPIRNAVQVVRLAGAPEAELRRAGDVIDRQVRQMARLLDDLLDTARISHGKLELRRERVELAAVIEIALETSRPLIDGAGRELAVTLPPEPVGLEADPVRLAQVFSNLLSNAAKYTEPGGRIRLAAERRDGAVEVAVEDDGIGIAPDMLPRIFDMFSQDRGAASHAGGGLGIGLALARAVVELHGGRIEARSGGGGRGSRFAVRLPVLEEPAAGTGPPPARRAAAAEKAVARRLLIVDDLRDSADTLAMLMRIHGHEAETAYDGEAAVAAAERLRPDVVLLDLGMPGLDGYDACRRIRSQPWGRGMLLVALTGWGQEADRRRTEEAGFDHHLVKPVDPAALAELLAAPRGGGS